MLPLDPSGPSHGFASVLQLASFNFSVLQVFPFFLVTGKKPR
jgi:hypothetical protein